MKELPIVERPAVIPKLLDGSRTMLRRIAKVPAHYVIGNKPTAFGPSDFAFLDMADPIGTYPTLVTAPYAIGDILWVREALKYSRDGTPTRYAIDNCPVMREGESIEWPWRRPYLPSVSMPKWAARIWLEVIDVKCEKVRAITINDAIEEGIHDLRTPENVIIKNYIECFAEAWDDLYGEGAWERNDWCWCFQFRRDEGQW